MTSLVLYVGIAMSFLTVWGVIMVGSFLLGGEADDAPTTVKAAPGAPIAAERVPH